MKKILLGVGTLVAVIAPLAATVACGEELTIIVELMPTVINSKLTSDTGLDSIQFQDDEKIKVVIRNDLITLSGKAKEISESTMKNINAFKEGTLISLSIYNDGQTTLNGKEVKLTLLETKEAIKFGKAISIEAANKVSSEDLDKEQAKVNKLTSVASLVDATFDGTAGKGLVNSAIKATTIALAKYGITFSPNYRYDYTYTATNTHITIMVALTIDESVLITRTETPVAIPWIKKTNSTNSGTGSSV